MKIKNRLNILSFTGRSLQLYLFLFILIATIQLSAQPLNNHLLFDGDDDYISLNNMDVSGSQITLEALINSTNLSNCGSDQCRIISKALSPTPADHYWMLSTTTSSGNTVLRFRLKTNGTTTSQVAELGSLSNNTWYHIAATYNGTTMKIFLDGREVGSTPKTGSLTTNQAANTWIGGNPPTATGHPWQGGIDEVRIWNTARTQAQIQANQNTELTGNEAGLQAYYKFNEGTGQTINDSAGNNNSVLGSNNASDNNDPSFALNNPDPNSNPTVIEGSIVISDSEVANPLAGSIRWTGQDFETFDGTKWKSLISNCDDNPENFDAIVACPAPNFVQDNCTYTVNWTHNNPLSTTVNYDLRINGIDTGPSVTYPARSNTIDICNILGITSGAGSFNLELLYWYDGAIEEAISAGVCRVNYDLGPSGDPVSIPSFPGAEGHGAESIGGRGGIVVKVTNINDSGPGSLREALMMTVPRMIVFEVSGTIELQSRISVGAANSFFTIAGQTAPGDGIALRNHPLDLSNVQHAIIRHLRVRHGCPVGCDVSLADNIRIFSGSNNIILDHISMTWAQDESFNIWGNNIHDVTVQWSLFGEGTVECVEDNNGHNLGPLFGGGPDQKRITISNNYIAHTCYRNYMQTGGQYEYINDLNYNTFSHDFNFSQSSDYLVYEQLTADIKGYYFKQGPQSTSHHLFDLIRYSSADNTDEYLPISLHIDDITAIKSDGSPHALTGDGNPANFIRGRTSGGTSIMPKSVIRSAPVSDQAKYPVSEVPSTAVPAKILPTVGASLPKRDAVDARIVDDFYTLGIWEAANVRQYPVLNTYNVRTDTDNDGMPDDWEISNGLNPQNPNDHSGDINNDGYTNIENYINSID